MSAPESPPKEQKRPNLGRRTLIGLGAGLVAGVLLGEYAGFLEPLGKAYILLLQMTVLPYMVVALLFGLGRLSPGQVRQVGVAGAAGFLAVWALGLGVVYCLSLALPPPGADTFHSNPGAGGGQAAQPGVFELIIPANPFAALAAGTVPAIAFFSLLLVTQLLNHPDKDVLLRVLGVLHDAIKGLTGRINATIPYGVFVLMAATAGTVPTDVVGRLAFYLALYILGTGLLAVLVLPLAVARTTPIPLGPLVRRSWGAMGLALACGSVFPALPLITETVLDLVKQFPGRDTAADPGDAEAGLESLIPVAYNFPHAGNIVSFLFVIFAASMYGRPLDLGDQVRLVVTGIPALFSGSVYSILFLLREMQLPEDAAQLFLDTFNLIARFGSAVGVMTLLCVSLWTHYRVEGGLSLRPARLLATFGLLFGTLAALAWSYGAAQPPPPVPAQKIYERLAVPERTETVRLHGVGDLPPGPVISGLERIQRRGELRVGYWESFPYLYTNASGQQTGYLLDLAQTLGADLQCRLVLVPVSPESFWDDLAAGRIDTALGPCLLGPEVLGLAGFSDPYLFLEPSLFLDDFDREPISRKVAQGGEGLVLAYPADSPALGFARHCLPQARFLRLPADAETASFPGAHALVWTRPEASAHAVLHPARGVLPLDGGQEKLPVVLPTRLDDVEFRGVLDGWIAFRTSVGTFDELRSLWFEGQEGKPEPPRQSLLLELLHVFRVVRHSHHQGGS